MSDSRLLSGTCCENRCLLRLEIDSNSKSSLKPILGAEGGWVSPLRRQWRVKTPESLPRKIHEKIKSNTVFVCLMVPPLSVWVRDPAAFYFLCPAAVWFLITGGSSTRPFDLRTISSPLTWLAYSESVGRCCVIRCYRGWGARVCLLWCFIEEPLCVNGWKHRNICVRSVKC